MTGLYGGKGLNWHSIFPGSHVCHFRSPLLKTIRPWHWILWARKLNKAANEKGCRTHLPIVTPHSLPLHVLSCHFAAPKRNWHLSGTKFPRSTPSHSRPVGIPLGAHLHETVPQNSKPTSGALTSALSDCFSPTEVLHASRPISTEEPPMTSNGSRSH
jgi:hypothetical protein